MKDYFKVIAVEGNDSADILLYGVIGQDFWWDDALNEESITDVAFVRKMKELEAKYSKINIRINSPGGSMYHGNAIVTAIQSSAAEVHVYNDGMAASMAADIWLAAPNRHMAKNSLLMIHSPSSFVWGTAAEMRKEADVLDKFEQTAIAIMLDTTELTEAQIKEQFYDYEDHWITAAEAAEMNLITKVEEYEVEGLPSNIEKMSFQDIRKHFEDKEDKSSQGLMSKIKDKWTAMFSRRMSANINIEKEEIDMQTIDDILKECKAGNLNAIDLAERLKAVIPEPAPAAPATPPAPAATMTMDSVQEMVTKAMQPLHDTINAQKVEIEKMKAAPAAPPTPAPKDGDDFQISPQKKTAKDELDALNKKIAESNGGFSDII